MLRKIILIQCRSGRRLKTEEVLFILRQKPDFIILPEYQSVDPLWRDTLHNAARSDDFGLYCGNLSDYLDASIVAGSGIEIHNDRYFNTSRLYDRGRLMGKYRKINPTANEKKYGLSPGRESCLFEINGVRISILICADVLDPDNFTRLKKLEPDIIFIPTTSPYQPNERIPEKYARDDRIFVAGAKVAGSYIVKCCAIGRLWHGQLQGRSLAAAPWGILHRIPPEKENCERILSFILDINELRDFRHKTERIFA